MEALRGRSGASARLFESAERRRHIWHVREAALGGDGAGPRHAGNRPGWEDTGRAAVRISATTSAISGALFAKYGYKVSVYGHFGDGLRP